MNKNIKIDPRNTKFSQISIKLEEQHLVILAEMVVNKKWNEKYSIDVVPHPTKQETFISLDNRRLYLARASGVNEVCVNIRKY
jgi:hypothetical protein